MPKNYAPPEVYATVMDGSGSNRCWATTTRLIILIVLKALFHIKETQEIC